MYLAASHTPTNPYHFLPLFPYSTRFAGSLATIFPLPFQLKLVLRYITKNHNPPKLFKILRVRNVQHPPTPEAFAQEGGRHQGTAQPYSACLLRRQFFFLHACDFLAGRTFFFHLNNKQVRAADLLFHSCGRLVTQFMNLGI